MKIISFLLLACVCISFNTNGQVQVLPSFSQIEETYVVEAEKFLQGKINGALAESCINNINSNGFVWYGTKPQNKDLQADEANFNVSFNGGDKSRETLITVTHVAGGYQSEFESSIRELIAGNPNLINNVQSLTTKIVEDALMREFRLIGDVVYRYWNCERQNNSQCKWDNFNLPNYGSLKCNNKRTSQDGLITNFCQGRFGLFKVEIEVGRKKKDGKGCKNLNNDQTKCFVFAILPTLPPGTVFNPNVVAEVVFSCDNGNSAPLIMPQYDAQNNKIADGVCWRKVSATGQETNFGCGTKFSRLVENINVSETWYGTYYKNYRNGCVGQKIYGIPKRFLVVPVQKIDLPDLQPALQIGCSEVCDVTYKTTVSQPYEEQYREIRWYKTALDRSETPFNFEEKLPGCYEETTTFYVTVKDSFPGCDKEQESEVRAPVTLLVLSDIFPADPNQAKSPVEQEFKIFDNRQTTINCTANTDYHVELETHNDELIDEILAESDPNTHLKQVQGYTLKRSGKPTINWYRLESDGTETSITDNPTIYKVENGKKYVCADNTDIPENDFNATVKYIGKFSLKVEVMDGQGNPVAPNNNCEELLQGFIIKEISLKQFDYPECENNIERLRGALLTSGALNGCNQTEYIVDCPSSNPDPEVGLDVEAAKTLINNTLPQNVFLVEGGIVNMNHKWIGDTLGLKSPDFSKTQVVFEEIPKNMGEFIIYKLDISATIDATQNGVPVPVSHSARHCSVVYLCPSCE